MFCSSEKINGNKTKKDFRNQWRKFCSSEKINGNKTIVGNLNTLV